VPMDGSAFGPKHGGGEARDRGGRRGPRRGRRALVAGGALGVVVIAAVIAIGASTLGEGTQPRTEELAAVEAPAPTASGTDATVTPTTAPSTAAAPTTGAPTPTTARATPTTSRQPGGLGTTVAPTPTTAAPVATPTTAPPAPTTTLPPVTMRLSINPKSLPQHYLVKDAPLLTWGVTNAATVHISGPKIDATTTSGSVRLCPGTPDANGFCNAPAGTYPYELEAKSADGTILGTRTATLTITGSLTIP
ncbi:MAG TPA: hypothetical protein VFX21_17000, partial [Acidimicrobiia bacterium]|nr:hypothetical protein [Acidimicrobiia bacterium]